MVSKVNNPQQERRVHVSAISKKMRGVDLEADAPTPAPGTRQKVEGFALIALIRKTLNDRSLPDRHIADVMGITTIYWNSLVNGHRLVKSLGRDKLKKAADFLGIPAVQARVLAGDISIEDFLVGTDTDGQLLLSIEKMRTDPQWMSLAPSTEEWAAMPIRVKMALAMLYERESGRALIKKAEIEVPGMLSQPA